MTVVVVEVAEEDPVEIASTIEVDGVEEIDMVEIVTKVIAEVVVVVMAATVLVEVVTVMVEIVTVVDAEVLLKDGTEEAEVDSEMEVVAMDIREELQIVVNKETEIETQEDTVHTIHNSDAVLSPTDPEAVVVTTDISPFSTVLFYSNR